MLLFERIDPDLNTTLTLEYDRKPQYKLECLSYENLLKMATSTYLYWESNILTLQPVNVEQVISWKWVPLYHRIIQT